MWYLMSFLLFPILPLWILFLCYLFFFVCFANPGIINDKKYSEKEIKEKYKVLRRFNCCQICHICVPETIKIGHCEYCGRCIIEQNHHSFIFGKCIGKYTFFVYFIFIFSEIIIVCKIVLKNSSCFYQY